MSLPTNFGLLGLTPSIRDNDAFLFLQTGTNGYIDMFIQSATGSPVNILTITSGVSISNKIYVNGNGSDSTGQRGSLSLPFATIGAALNSAIPGDTIEVFPGNYTVTGNMIKEATDYYFHNGSYVNFTNQGRIEASSLMTGVRIEGFLSLTNNGSYNRPVNILSGPVIIKCKSIDCGTGEFYSSGGRSFIEGVKNGNNLNSTILAPKMTLIDAKFNFYDIRFSTSNLTVITASGSSGPNFRNCTLDSRSLITQPCSYNFTGRADFDNCDFDGFCRFISLGDPSTVKNSVFYGGIIASGSSYFEDCVFETLNYNMFPKNSLITSLGGDPAFKDCYARNRNNTSYVTYTFSSSGSASGASNFNVINSFTSFKPTGVGVTVKYGLFNYNPSFL